MYFINVSCKIDERWDEKVGWLGSDYNNIWKRPKNMVLIIIRMIVE